MSQEQNYNQLLDELLQDVDMNDDVARKIAHNRCLEYAQHELEDDPEVNMFLALAAERLGQTRIHLSLIKGMVSMPEDARLHLTYSPQGGPTLTGNVGGLRYLSDICAVLAAAPVSNGALTAPEHVHLYDGESPMFGNSYGLTVYNEPNAWFDKHGIPMDDVDDTEGGLPAVPPREIIPEQIAALEFFEGGPLPPVLLLRLGKLYRVLEVRHYDSDKVWSKPFPDGEADRVFVFTIHDDSDSRFEMALHLDDPSIHFFTFHDLEQISGQ
jgi:hypothetical protein